MSLLPSDTGDRLGQPHIPERQIRITAGFGPRAYSDSESDEQDGDYDEEEEEEEEGSRNQDAFSNDPQVKSTLEDELATSEDPSQWLADLTAMRQDPDQKRISQPKQARGKF